MPTPIKDFVIIDPDTHDIFVNKDVVMLYDVFNKIMRRDPGSKGDADGRKKYHFLKELGYIMIIADPEAYPYQNGYSDEQAHKYAIEQTGLSENYKPDALVQNAIYIYRNELLTAVQKIAYGIKKGLNNWIVIMEKCNEEMEKILSGKMTIKELSEIILINKNILDIATVAPEQIKKIDAIIKGFDDNTIMSGQIRGGGENMDSMDPDKSIG